MAVALEIPPSLREHAGGLRVVRGTGATLEEFLDNLEQRYPMLIRHLREAANFSRFFAVRINDRRFHHLRSPEVRLSPGDTVRFIPNG